MKKILLIKLILFTSLIQAQVLNFKVQKKLSLSGTFIIYIEYNDSINWEKNKILYSLCVPKDSILDNSFTDFVKVQNEIKIETIINYQNYHYYGLFYDYLFKYPKYAYSKNSLEDSIKSEIAIAYNKMLKDSFDFFSLPFLTNVSGYGLYKRSIPITCEGYLISFHDFEEYQHEFISTTNDNKFRKLVGVMGSKIYASLYEIKDNSNDYKVFLPLEILK